MVGERSGRTRRLVGLVLLLLLLAVVGAVVAPWLLRSAQGSADPELAPLLIHRGRVAWVGAHAVGSYEGTTLEPIARTSPLMRALLSADPTVPARALDARHVGVLVIERDAADAAPVGSVLETLGRFGVVPGFRTLLLRDDLVVVERFALPRFTEREVLALARAARLIIGGAIPPRLSQFPASLRAPFATEVLVLVRRTGGDLALWRSARSSSVASGVLTAAGIARQRWEARTDTVGGPIADSLPRVSVEVALLVEDGTFSSHDPAFIDRALTPQHGVAYDDASAWHYLLPESPERRGAVRPSDAFRALFNEKQVRGDGFERSDLRLYRVSVVPVSVSAPDSE